MYLNISLIHTFSSTLVSPGLLATSALEMQDLPLPICISYSLFASFVASLFPTFISVSGSEGMPAMCIPEPGWECRVTAGKQAPVLWEDSLLLSVHAWGTVCVLIDHLIIVMWSMDHLKWGQEGRWRPVRKVHFDIFLLVIMHQPSLAPNLQTLLGSRRPLGALAQSLINVPLFIRNPGGSFIKQISKI